MERRCSTPTPRRTRSWPPSSSAARSGELPADWADKSQAYIAKLQAEGPDVASRKASQMALDAFGPLLPELIGGSADLAGSNLTMWKGSKDASPATTPTANYVYYGVREFGMTAIANGLALHGGFIPYDATFLVFSDYARNAVRMSALIPAHAIHVYTHDSIGLGEDGPTHQPVEHLASAALHPEQRRVAPVRCGRVGGVRGRRRSSASDGPACLVFSRQTLKHQQRSDASRSPTSRAAATCCPIRPTRKFKAILIATGSEVELAMEAARTLAAAGRRRCAWCRCRAPSVFDAPAAGIPRRRAAGAGAARAWRWKPASPISGASTWAWMARWSA